MQKGKTPRTKKQLMKLTQKWVLRAKQGLRKSGFKDQNWSHLEEEEQTVKEKREKKSRERRGIRRDQGQKGMETHLDYEFYEIWHVSLGLYDDYLA